MESYVATELGVEGVGEPEHSAAVTRALAEYPGAAMRGHSLAYCVPGQSIFLRPVKLPPSQPQQLAQMVRFEAQQNVPFPMHEVVWDYQLLPGRQGDVEAVIVAIKSDLLDRINGAVSAVGALPDVVDVAPLALYNAVRFNYPDDADGCTLVLDIGAKSTHMLFIEPGRMWVRGVPIAGNQMTQAVATELGVSMEQARELKHAKGFVGLGGAYEDPPDAEAARISKVIRSVLARLHADVNRSIGFYKSQQGGVAPSRVLLTGGCSALPYIDLFFAEKLRVPVERLNPLRNISLGEGVDREQLQMEGHLLGETVGVALRALGNTPIEVNLVPVTAAAKKAALGKVPLAAGAVATVALLFGGLWLADHVRAGHLESLLSERQNELTALQTVAKKVKSAQDAYNANVALANDLKRIAADRTRWVALLADLNQRVPAGVWVTSMQPTWNEQPTLAVVGQPVPKPGGQMDAAGREVNGVLLEGCYEAYDARDVQDPSTGVIGADAIKSFFDRLAESPELAMTRDDFNNPQVAVIQSSSVGEKKLALTFKVQLKLKQPIPLVP
jgi:type IV pilus assembly protein PilM